MVNGIGSGGLGRAAIDAALRQMRERAGTASPQVAQAEVPSFTETLQKGVTNLDSAVKAAEDLPLRVVKGELDFHEVAAQIKESELSFEFTMQVRNKLIDAYREVMRMSV
jgi:flagellar hook-basal body complex protein FliE